MFLKFVSKLFFLRNSKLNSSKTAWVESSFVFEKANKMQTKDFVPKSHLGTSFTKNKQSLFIILMLIPLLAIFTRVVYLQIFSGQNYMLIADSNRQKVIPIPAERGHIFDRNGIQLTKNIPNFALALVPQQLPRSRENRLEVVDRLSKITGQSREELIDTLEEFGNYQYESIVIQEDLAYEDALSIYIELVDLPGIEIQQGSKRLYVSDNPSIDSDSTSTTLSMSHVIGYQGKLTREELDNLYDKGYLPSDSIGKTGIEKNYEETLRGIYGRRVIEVNAIGDQQSLISEVEPEVGGHVVLSIDTEMQTELEKMLQDQLDISNKKRASAVVLDPRNGEVLAMVSLPTYDSNDFSGGIDSETYNKYIENEDRPLFNRSISGTYPSGSTLKPAVASAALQEGIINRNSSFLSNGGVRVGVWFFPDWQAGGHGVTDVRRSLAWSVNTFYYYIGGGHNNFTGLGVDKISTYLRTFGFAQRLGIDLPAEQAGFIPSREWKEETKKEQWYIGDTYNLSIGQGDVLVTPLQIASMTAAVANGGKVYQPRTVKSVIDQKTGLEESKKPSILHENIIASSHLNTIRLGMRDCVTYGSCRRLANHTSLVAGKTGTAQWSSTKEPHGWFTSFAPYNDPRVVLTVLVEEGEGGTTAAVPVADRFYRWWESNRL